MVGWLAGIALADEDLARNFATPPASARPWVYWFQLSGNQTKEGITADLEAMARVGIGGVLYMEVNDGVPSGPVDYAGPLWRELFQHACKEARRLGLEINMNNDAGWCGSGGPWITPELSMQKVVWTETPVDGGKRMDLVPPQAGNAGNSSREIAVMAMPAPEGKPAIGDIAGKASFIPQHFPPQRATFAANAEAAIAHDKILDLTGKTSWDVPPGKWLVIRFGHASTGTDNHPAPEPGRGLECDKFSKEAATVHYNGLMGKLVADNKSLSGRGKVLVSTHIDSWETGSQNWTPKMREEFKNRRGYDLLPFLPVFTGRIVGSVEVTERFLWDLRQTVSDLIVENYAGEFRRLANKDGLRLSIEAYDQTPADEITYAGQADEPMGEFWKTNGWNAPSCTVMASAAHVYGHRILGAEAFTSTDMERWLDHPGSIKSLGDWALCEGVNRFVFHRYAAQPWANVAPGMSMGPWGLHYERTQTWWEQSKAWHEYLARCQYLLRQGLFVADICYLQPEGAPRRFWPPPGAWAVAGDQNTVASNLRGGYNFDGCTPEVVLTRMSVENGRIMLPDGMSYRVLVLPRVETMTPRLLGKIKELVSAGATVFAPTPPLKAPGLTGYPQCDADVKKLADEIWGGTPPPSELTERQLGKGRLIWGGGLAPQPPGVLNAGVVHRWLEKNGVPPDFLADKRLRYIHRSVGHKDIYFVANPEPQFVEAVCTFRTTGRKPAAWFPETGRIEPISVFEETKGCTRIPLNFEPAGSLFVVFEKGTVMPSAQIVNLARSKPDDAKPARSDVASWPAFDPVRLEASQNGTYPLTMADGTTREVAVAGLPDPVEIRGPWEISFAPGRGAPDKVVLAELVSWSEHSDQGVKYFSGAATYRKTFNSPPVLKPKGGNQTPVIYLDLGKVAVMAEVSLNGKNLGVLWKAPYRVDISGAVKNGENILEIKVVNLWVNRMIGDELLPEDSERVDNRTLKQWPQWLQEGKPSPTGRYTFTSCRLWKKGEPLRESGLIGPVTLRIAVRVDLKKEVTRPNPTTRISTTTKTTST